MTPLTRRDVIAHQSVVPWPNQFQVEQDLLLCWTMAALFGDRFLESQIAMRGGTLLHKVYLPPPSRYSEDIDLVVVGNSKSKGCSCSNHRIVSTLSQIGAQRCRSVGVLAAARCASG